MSWIDVIQPEDAKGLLAKLYAQVATPEGHVDAILKCHSLRPRTLSAHLALYKATLHSRPTELSARETELVGACVSQLNGCNYCVQHHRAALARHVGDPEIARTLVEEAVGGGEMTELTDRERRLCDYAIKLTREPEALTPDDLTPLRQVALDDAGILDLNQVVAYFSYANRTVQGLGVETGDEPLGLHPSDESDSLRHG